MATLRKIITEFTFKGDPKQITKMETAVSNLKSKFAGLNPIIKQSLGIFGAFQAVRFAKSMLVAGNAFAKLAEDAAETESKFNVVFSSVNKQSKEFADNLVKNYGLGRTESKELLSDTGDLLTGFGFTQKEALNMSDSVQKMAVDLASFTNITGGSTRASKAITKALIGERESMKLLGISILEDDIKREARSRGLSKQLTKQQKAQITLDLIFRQSKNAIGDYGRTMDSASNRSKLATKRMNDLKIAIGKMILPIRRLIIEFKIRLTNSIMFLLPLIKVFLIGLGALTTAFLILKANVIAFGIKSAIAFAIAFWPVALLTAGLVLLGLAIEDIYYFLKGRESFIGDFLDLERVKSIAKDLRSIFKKLGEDIWFLLKWPFERLFDFFDDYMLIIDRVTRKISGFFGKEKGINLNNINDDTNIVPTKSLKSNSSNINNNSAMVQSPNITVNVENKGNGGQTLIKDISKGIQEGLQSSLNQSLRTMA